MLCYSCLNLLSNLLIMADLVVESFWIYKKHHSILLQKREHYGKRGNALDWFQSYLTGRSQYVTVNGHVSNFLPITCGVPQGSVLGLLLFLIYVNDLPNFSKILQFYLFADDTSIYFDSDDLITL